MKSRKILAAALAAVLTAAPLTACQAGQPAASSAAATSAGGVASGLSGSKGNVAKGSLRVAVLQESYDPRVWEQVAAAFEKAHPNLQVTLEINPDMGSQLLPRVNKGEDLPDLIQVGSGNASGLLQSMILQHQLADLSDVFTPALRKKMIAGTYSGATFQPYDDGKIYAAPLFYSVSGLWYDKHLFAQNKWTVPKTWDEAYQLGEAAAKKGVALCTYGATDAPQGNATVLWPMIASAGGDKQLQALFDYAPGAWNQGAVRDSLAVFEKLRDKKLLLDGTLGMNGQRARELWLQGKALFLPAGSDIQQESKALARSSDFQFGFAPVPVIQAGQQPCVWSACEEMYVPAKAKNIAAAKAFIRFLYEADTIALMAKTTHRVPPVKGAAEAAKSALDEATLASLQAGESDSYHNISGAFQATSGTEKKLEDECFKGINDIMASKTTAAALQKKLEQSAGQLVAKKPAASAASSASSALSPSTGASAASLSASR